MRRFLALKRDYRMRVRDIMEAELQIKEIWEGDLQEYEGNSIKIDPKDPNFTEKFDLFLEDILEYQMLKHSLDRGRYLIRAHSNDIRRINDFKITEGYPKIHDICEVLEDSRFPNREVFQEINRVLAASKCIHK